MKHIKSEQITEQDKFNYSQRSSQICKFTIFKKDHKNFKYWWCLWAADLVIVGNYEDEKKGYLGTLSVKDTFSTFLWVEPLK